MLFLCSLFGYTRQAYYKQKQYDFEESISEEIIIKAVKDLRKEMPRCGVRKLVKKLLDLGFSIGRDHLFDVLRRDRLLVARRRSHPTITTNSNHWFRRYPNIIKGMLIDGPNQLWVSDITYIPIHKRKMGYAYLSLITDAYTHEIVGECLHDTLDTDGPMNALIMALSKCNLQHK